jgi:branched-subunit amino acid aminotransferase/4-amino-4-deoxychorismate lyase
VRADRAAGQRQWQDVAVIAELNGAPLADNRLQTLALTNYGNFTSFIVDHGRVRGLELHLERLDRDSRAMHGTGLDKQATRGLIAKAAKQIDGRAVLRVTLFDPGLDLGHPAAVLDPHVLVTARPAPAAAPGPVNLAVVAYSRDLPEIKHTGLMRTVALRRQAQRDSHDDVAFCDERQRLSEGATWNMGFIDHTGTLVLPDQPRLEGVTLRLLLGQADTAGVPYEVRTITVTEARTLPAGMITNAAVGVRPISTFDGARLDPEHPALATLRALYDQVLTEPV